MIGCLFVREQSREYVCVCVVFCVSACFLCVARMICGKQRSSGDGVNGSRGAAEGPPVRVDRPSVYFYHSPPLTRQFGGSACRASARARRTTSAADRPGSAA